ncbi:uncharacterized protein LOC9662446 isoform X2 [Selaginella moellendorffii]|uniref:uncharacterized protein LOC9662446 isoform X2 n=1 Tax=Selaginella moellendorffii TaxID=88036 RepID=UPI000D1CE63B|nr:uncharacterized protein LOC9662446 isoform X2 [Selaginella moellendorffii]|eukprot:XP_024520104.1 uncharacterized protein LOC9662446 isoform X2 [Selaginella moellendorffii]
MNQALQSYIYNPNASLPKIKRTAIVRAQDTSKPILAGSRSQKPISTSGQRSEDVFKSSSPISTNLRFLGLASLTRPDDVVPSLMLSLGGSWMTANLSLEFINLPLVWTTALCSACIAGASMLANDCYDHSNGTDALNKRESALESGQLEVAHVALASGCIYGAALLGACYLETLNARLLVATSALITFIYTPLFKKVTIVKNLVVAAVVASSILAGGLAITGDAASFPMRTYASTLYIFLSILGREILKDVVDVDGDRVTGVRTFPVIFGRELGIVLSGACSLGANVFLAKLLWSNSSHFVLLIAMVNSFPMHFKLLKLLMLSNGDANVESVVKLDTKFTMAFGLYLLAIAV